MKSTGIEIKPLTPDQAVANGTMLSEIARHYPDQTRLYIAGEIWRVVQKVQAKTTLDINDVPMVVTQIMREHPTLRVEELPGVFDGMIFGKYGKYYERLKEAEIMDAFRQYENTEVRVQAFERQHKIERVSIEIKSTLQWEYVQRELLRRGIVMGSIDAGTQLKVAYFNVEGGKYDISEMAKHTVLSAKDYLTKPKVIYSSGQGRMDTSKLSSALRRELQVDPKVIAQYEGQRYRDGV